MTDASIRTAGQSAPIGIALLRFGIPVVAMVSAILWGVWTHRAEVQAATDRAVQNAALINQYIERLVQTQTILQRAAVERAQGEDAGFLGSEAFHLFLQRIEKTQALTQGLIVVASDGTLVAASRIYPVNAKLGHRDYIDAIAGGETLFIDRMVLEQSKQDVLVVATPFTSGPFRGVIATGMEIGIVRDFLQGIAANDGEAASLTREDGKLLVRQEPSDPIMLPAESPVLQAMRNADAGSVRLVAASDGVERIYGYARVHDLPLFANFGEPMTAVTRAWLFKVLPVWALLAAIGGFTFLMGGQVQRSISAQFEAEANRRRLGEAERLAEQRRQLMGEMNHRVKNNLALVAALISLQMRRQGGIDGAELKARVMAISEVHEFLYRTPDSEQMDFGEILTRICTSPAILPVERNIRLDLQVAPGIIIEPDHATALALSAAEILTNAVKHAFVGRADGAIAVHLTHDGAWALMDIRDDGVGLPKSPDRSSGLRIVDGLVAQVGGTITRASEGGTRVMIRFPLQKAKPAN